jgi:hypothetical protein
LGRARSERAANAAAKSKTSYLGALYIRLASRRGRKRALIAVAHAILISIYHMLSRQEVYQDLGYGYVDERKRKIVTNQQVRRLERLGYQVNLSHDQTSSTIPSRVGRVIFTGEPFLPSLSGSDFAKDSILVEMV